MKRLALVIPCLLFIGACSSGESSVASSPSSSSDPVSTTTGSAAPPSSDPVATTTTSTAPPSTQDGTAIAEALKADVGSVQKVVTITEDNDPNNKIGRPNGYVSAAVIYDSGVVDCGDDLGVDCGATVEVWPSADAAKERSEYIQGLQKNSPILGTEYNYLNGAALLRVSGNIKPTVAEEYESAFSNG